MWPCFRGLIWDIKAFDAKAMKLRAPKVKNWTGLSVELVLLLIETLVKILRECLCLWVCVLLCCSIFSGHTECMLYHSSVTNVQYYKIINKNTDAGNVQFLNEL